MPWLIESVSTRQAVGQVGTWRSPTSPPRSDFIRSSCLFCHARTRPPTRPRACFFVYIWTACHVPPLGRGTCSVVAAGLCVVCCVVCFGVVCECPVCSLPSFCMALSAPRIVLSACCLPALWETHTTYSSLALVGVRLWVLGDWHTPGGLQTLSIFRLLPPTHIPPTHSTLTLSLRQPDAYY